MDKDADNELEDGELSDESGGVMDLYTPLERPSAVPVRPDPVISESSDRDEPSSGSESSDSDNRGSSRNPRRRKKCIAKAAEVIPPKRKNYGIWCSNAMDDNLADDLVKCNVDLSVDRSRDVESYDYLRPVLEERNQITVPARFVGRLGTSNKRNASGRSVGQSGHKRCNKATEIRIPTEQMQSREILPLVKSDLDSVEELAKDMANKLLEEKEDVVLNVINAFGKQRAIEIFEFTAETEKNGGLLIMNGSRRRTPGGVFFFLAKTAPDATKEIIQQIFGDSNRATAREIKRAKSAKRRAFRNEDFNTLLTKAEAAIKNRKAVGDDDEDQDRIERQEGFKNPPPSPATDGKESDGDCSNEMMRGLYSDGYCAT